MVSTRSRITAIEAPGHAASWRDLATSANAPVFYRPEFLAAYRSYPLRPIHDSRRLLLVDAHRNVLAGLPVYLVDFVDPFQTIGVPAAACPETRQQRMVISHFWHCYDTRLLARELSVPLVEAAMDTLRWHAAQWQADACGFINVSARDPLGECLETIGIRRAPARERYRIPLGGIRSVEDYLAGLRPRIRHEARRCLRRAQEAGVTVRVHAPPASAGLLSQVAELLGHTADRHNPGYYPPHLVVPFLRSVGPTLRIIALWQGGRAIAVGICFADGRVFHAWALGVRPGTKGHFSPFVILLVATVSAALAEDCGLIELGRTNGEWKQRHGAVGLRLASWLAMDGW